MIIHFLGGIAMGRVDINKEVNTGNKKITGSMKTMYYFLVGVSAVIPVLYLLQLCYLDIYAIDGSLAEHTQYYLWNSPKMFKQIYKETADGGFFLMVSLIPVVMIIFSMINCIVSLMKAFTVKVSWKHAEAANRACTTSIASSAVFILIYNIVSEFFEQKSGFSGQELKCNAFVFIILGLAIVGKVTAHIYFNKVRENHLF